MAKRAGTVEDMVKAPAFLDRFRDVRVLITGHTGFKGAWLAAWLQRLGAEVAGFALPPEDGDSNLFAAADVGQGMSSVIGDLRDRHAVDKVFAQARPEIVFHLAAQSLVRRSYREPVETFDTNLMGTVHVLDAARRTSGLKAVVVVTTDKCYRNRERPEGYREDDAMGGADPYSSSKGCAELATDAYRRSFFSGDGSSLIASARAGNVIGGGDWCEDRLVPDIAKAIAEDRPVILRHPDSVRPWQHVLEPLRGYLMLGSALLGGERTFAEGWNFGPDDSDAVTVGDLAEKITKAWGKGTVEHRPAEGAVHEATLLMLNTGKSRKRLGYRPMLSLDDAVRLSVEWYRAYLEQPSRAAALCAGQINDYMKQLS